MATDYRIERMERADLDALAVLRSQVYGGPPPSAHRSYLDWKYWQNPYIDTPLLWGARWGTQLVAMRGAMGTAWNVPGLENALVIPQAADTAIAADHRDRGLHALLNEVAVRTMEEDGHRFAINLSATPANYVASIMHMGWKTVTGFQLLRRQPRWDDTADQPGSAPSRPSALSRVMKRAVAVAPFARIDVRARSRFTVFREPPDVVMTRLGEPPRRVRHQHDEPRVWWRFRNPLMQYRFVTGDSAWLALGAQRGRPTVSIIDWSGPDDAVADLVRTAAPSISPSELWGVSIGPTLRGHLDNDRFRSVTQRRSGMLARTIGDRGWTVGSVDLSEAGAWDLRMIDSDRY